MKNYLSESQNNYQALLKMPQWLKKRTMVLERDRYSCRNCGTSRLLQVHHRQYHTCRRTGLKKHPWQYSDKYLITLCSNCHEKGHRLYQVKTFSI